MNDNLDLGIDVGSTTVKIAALNTKKETVFYRYVRHNACQSETVLAILKEIFSLYPNNSFKVAVCGSGGKTIADLIHAPYIQEVVANSIVIRNRYPAVRVAVELGGQDAKIIFFYKDEKSGKLIASDMRMNGSCAGGTGAFIDEIAKLLQCPIEEFNALATKGKTVYPISGRCGVFAKTDIQPLLNQGCLREDIALSAFHAIAKQTIGGLAQGLALNPPIIFEGGPLTFNPRLVTVFEELLHLKNDDVIRAPQSEILIAQGAALSLDEMWADWPEQFSREAALNALFDYHKNILSLQKNKASEFFNSPEDKKTFEARHNTLPESHNDAAGGSVLRVYLGIDAGSTTSKFVLIDEDENVIDRFYDNNRGDPLRVIQKALISLKDKYEAADITLDILGLGTTGYGELLFAKAFGADYHTVETAAHAESTQKYFKDIDFILDIGGQDMKAISLSNGVVTNITLNEACSSGCGSFLENFASTLNIEVKKIAEAAFNAKNPAELGSRCTVFMNSTIITEQKNGKSADDIMAGLCRAIIENVFTKVIRVANPAALGNRIVVQGGTFKNDAVLRAFEQYIGKEVFRAPYPGEMGAIGIALLTKKSIEQHGYTSPHGPHDKTRFIGLNALSGFDYSQQTNVICQFCANSCSRTLVTFSNGVTWVTGNRCERGEIVGDISDDAVRERVKASTKKLDSIPDMFAFREKLLFKDYPYKQIDDKKNITIGIPRVLDFWRSMPFWTVFFTSLGFNVRISRASSQKLFESGLPFVASDTVCFPAKLVHGHIQDLAKSGVDRIFMPLLNQLPSDNPEPDSYYTCPVLKGYGIVIKYSDNPALRWNTPFDTPLFHWFTEHDKQDQLCDYMRQTYNISGQKTKQAIEQGERALQTFNNELVKEGAKIIQDVEKSGRFAVIIGGRPYQFDNLVNHKLSAYFTNIGIPVLTVDSVPGVQDVDLSRSKLDITNNNHAQLLSGAIIAAKNPALEYVEIFSFGCGHDALLTDEMIRLMNDISGKAPLILKLDESDVAGPLRIRIRSFIETVKARREKQGVVKTESLLEPYAVKFHKGDRRGRTILVPNTSVTFTKILSAAIKKQNCRAVPLPLCGVKSIEAGKKYLHNDICFPAQVVVGEAITVLQSGKYKTDEVAVGMVKYNCDCRLTNYTYLLRKALDDAGFKDVPIITTDLKDKKNIHPGFRLKPISYLRAIWVLIMTDILEDLRRKIRPYELEKGETNSVYDRCIENICAALETKGMWAAFFEYKKCINAMGKIRYDKSEKKPLVFVIGEYLVNYHPDCNFYIEEYLEKNNMEVQIPRMYDIFRKYLLHTISDVADFNVHHSFADTATAFGGNAFFDFALNLMEHYACKHPLYEKTARLPVIAKRSDSIIHKSINSGESFLISAEIMHHAEKGVQSFVILQPFGCMPNHVCGRGIIKRVKEEFPSIQILPLDYDPDTSYANIENRLQMLIMNTKSTRPRVSNEE